MVVADPKALVVLGKCTRRRKKFEWIKDDLTGEFLWDWQSNAKLKHIDESIKHCQE